MRYRFATLYRTIQGEGYWSGTPVVLVRLQGCHVGCPWCDTRETWDPAGGHSRTAESIAQEARRIAPAVRVALLTGGEPLEQDVSDLIGRLHGVHFAVHVETSGTAPLPASGPPPDWLTVSPKIGMPGGKDVRDDVLLRADEIKMVVGKRKDIDTLQMLLACIPIRSGRPVVSLQPLSESAKATELCVNAAMEHGWRVSLQTHKILAIP